MIRVVGIDPGKSGGIAFYGEAVTVFPMPDNLTDLAVHFDTHKNSIDHVFLEKAQPMPKQGVVSVYGYGHHNGAIEGILSAYFIPYTLVKPQTWMKVMHAGADSGLDTKGKSVQVCRRLFPGVDLTPGKKTKPHDGMAEALLIAEYGRRILTGRSSA
jgi:hypothetical protein